MVIGFIDLVGSDDYNFVLLKCWVELVVVYLKVYGFKIDLMMVLGCGKVDLVVFNVMLEGCVSNCCVEIWL